ncbi:MAG: redoxin domain-containing protein [Bulleidia sp.]
MIPSSLGCFSLFLEGLLSFLSPCVLPLLPLYIGYLTADVDRRESSRKVVYGKILIRTFFFVLGIGTVFVLTAAGLRVLHGFFTRHAVSFQFFGGFLLLFSGLVALHILDVPFLRKTYQKQVRFKGNGNLHAYLLGFFFSFSWSPCVGPLLAGALVVAANAESHLQGMLYIASYAFGFLFLFILVGFFTDTLLAFFKKHGKITEYAPKVGGVLLVMMGIYMLVQANNAIRTVSPEPIGSAPSASAESMQAEEKTDIEKNDFTLKSDTGDLVALSSYKGKTVLVNFFATWCGYCNQEMPDLQKIHDRDAAVQILLVAAPSINGEEDEEAIAEFMRSNGYTMTLLYDTGGEVNRRYGVQGYPTTFIIKPDGNFLGYMPGYMSAEVLDKVLAEAAK